MTDVRRGYDALADESATSRELSDRERRILDGFLDALPETSRVLDAGCGPGTVLGSAVGLDFSREQLRHAADRLSVLQGDLSRLPFSENSFDAVVASNAVIHVPPTTKPCSRSSRSSSDPTAVSSSPNRTRHGSVRTRTGSVKDER